MSPDNKPDALTMTCYCGTSVAVEYNSTVDGEHGHGDYYEGICPECGMILTAGVYDAQ